MRLTIRRKPFFILIAPRVGLGYRRNKNSPGTWVARGPDGHGGYWTKAFGIADDNEPADGVNICTFWQAQDKARAIVRGDQGHGDRPITVAEALDNYAADLLSRSGSTRNASRVRRRLPPSLAAKTVTLLSARDLRHWRDGLLASGLKHSTVDRTCKMLKAALNLAAKDDPRITNTAAWRTGLPPLPEQELPVNRIISDDMVRKIVAGAYRTDTNFGLLVETAAVTGARPSQLARLEVADLRDDNGTPQLTMPSSRKGRRRRVTRQLVPISLELASRLRQSAIDRQPTDPLLVKADRTPWTAASHLRLFRSMAAAIDLDAGVTFYSLRHSSIVRQLLAGVPTRVVAAGHDTSVGVMEHTYSRYIGTVSDAVVRGALIDFKRGRP
jgi:integrase